MENRLVEEAIAARLRDVAEAEWHDGFGWADIAADWEDEIVMRIRGEWNDEGISRAIGWAIYYRGMLSLCEAED
jgi:hypothetical protein